MNREQISSAIECWEKERLIAYIENLQNVMYSACKVSLDLCDTCDLEPKTCNLKTNVYCENKQLRKDITKVKVGTGEVGKGGADIG